MGLYNVGNANTLLYFFPLRNQTVLYILVYLREKKMNISYSEVKH